MLSSYCYPYPRVAALLFLASYIGYGTRAGRQRPVRLRGIGIGIVIVGVVVIVVCFLYLYCTTAPILLVVLLW